MKTLRSDVAECARNFAFDFFEGYKMFGTAKINKFDVDFVFGTVTLFKEDNVFEFDIKVNDKVLM